MDLASFAAGVVVTLVGVMILGAVYQRRTKPKDWDFQAELKRIDEASLEPYDRIEMLRDWADAAVYELKAAQQK